MNLPVRDFTNVPANRLSVWQHISKVRQDFWKRWHLEYLNELQMRNKWNSGGMIVQPGTVALIKDKLLPCLQWHLGRVIKVQTGTDGIVRVAWVKTASGEIKRNVTMLCPLPINNTCNE